MENLKPLNERRYIVGYDYVTTSVEKFVVFVVDKWNQRIVYKAEVKDRQKAYPSIQRIYDRTDCIPPKQMRLALFE